MLLTSLVQKAPWCVDYFNIEGKILEIRGWALPHLHDVSELGFTVNDTLFDEIIYPTVRDDIERIFWYVKNAKLSGFTCRTDISGINTGLAGEAVFKYVNKADKKPFNENHNYYVKFKNEEIDIPPPENRLRSHGGISESSFLLEGFSIFKKLEYAIKKYNRKTYEDFPRILDWGCGCGRITRYFSAVGKNHITGVDIDNDNIEWCMKHLTFAEFATVPLYPPTQLFLSAFDLIFGISVFTHLTETAQYQWLSELQRIASENAVILMSVHSDASASQSGLPIELLENWKSKGLVDAGVNKGLTGAIEAVEYYRNIYHTRDYIYKNWSDYFKIIDIIPGYIGNHQDLIVMTKK